jgi:hypothetical protein
MGSPHRVCGRHLSDSRCFRERESSDPVAWIPKKIAKDAAAGYGNCSTEAKAVFSETRLPVKDELQKFHEQNVASDPHYAIARQLLDLGEAVARLREDKGLTRGELGKQLRVKARDIALLEEETPRAAAGLLEAALSLLANDVTPNMQQRSEVLLSMQRIRQLRPALVPM